MADIEPENKGCTKQLCCETLMAAACNMGAMACGCAIAWPSPAYVIMTNPAMQPLARDVALTSAQFSWYSASMFGAAACGAPIGAALARRVGSRWTLLVAAAPLMVSWLLIATAERAAHVLAGRLFAGVTTGCVFTVAPVYTAMIASDSIRGALGSMLQIELCVGVLLVYVLGPYVTLEVLGWICMGLTGVYFVCFAFCKGIYRHITPLCFRNG